ncbi:MAG TPA: GNAT family protein [Dongiaceae bacterium]|jgi:ribosomal-protein-alanine N-acetyltransferase
MRFRFPHFIIPRGNRLDGTKIYLQPPRYRDWRAWAALRAASREFLTPWEPTWPPDCLSQAAYRRRMRQSAAEWHDDLGYAFLVFRRSDDTLLGGINISNVRRGVSQAASLGYWIGGAFARQGIMTEALTCLMPFLLDRLGLHRIEAACMPHNAASRSLLRKVGFREEGYARDYLRINGTWQDHVLYALLRKDLAGAVRLAGTQA